MTDIREVFVTTENASNEGVPLSNAVDATTAAAALNGSVGFSFKDSSGNVILPQLNDEGAIVVSQDAGTPFGARAEDANGSTSLADLAGSEVIVTLGESYNLFKLVGCCTRETLFQLVHTDDAGVGNTETVLADIIVGSGAYSKEIDLGRYTFDTTGGTGIQNFKIKYQNFIKASTVRAFIGFNEKPA